MDGNIESVLERLTSKFGESRQSVGLGSNNTMIEVFASPETGTWTVLMSRADGFACVIASGTDWHQRDPGVTLLGVPS